jgi:cytochrome P450
LKPRGLDSLFEKILPKKVQEFHNFVEASVEKRRKEEALLERSEAEDSQGRKDMFHYLFKAKDDQGNLGYSTEELYAETLLLVVAGSDTTSTTMAGFWFYLGRYPRVYNKVTEKIRTTFKSADDIKIGPALVSCKYLQACIEETLRTAPAGCGEMPREVLPGGLDIEGNHIPEGVHVGVAVWSIVHNQEVFGDPWVFRPGRWIVGGDVTEEDAARDRNASNPFSIGSGNCVGQKLAMQELLITFAKTLYRMDVRLVPGDTLGAGSPELGWGLRDRNNIILRDAYIAIRNGPMVQFRKRTT